MTPTEPSATVAMNLIPEIVDAVRSFLDETSDTLLSMTCRELMRPKPMTISFREAMRSPDVFGYVLGGVEPTRTELILIAARDGNIPMMEYLFSREYSLNWDMIEEAALYGQLAVVRWLIPLTTSPPIGLGSRIMSKALEGGHIHVAEYLVSMGYEMNEAVLSSAAKSGSVEAYKWVEARLPSPIPSIPLETAASSGSIPMIELALSRGHTEETPGAAMAAAASSGNLQAVEWMNSRGYAIISGTFPCHEIAIIRWLHRHRGMVYGTAMQAAFATGTMGDIRWLLSLGISSSAPYSIIVHRGDLTLAQHLYVMGIRPIEQDVVQAIVEGKIGMLRWMHSVGAVGMNPWTRDVCRNLFLRAGIPMLRWARAHGCPLPSEIGMKMLWRRPAIKRWVDTAPPAGSA